MEKDIRSMIEELVDYLLPDLTPYETSLYLYLLRRLNFGADSAIRVGKRSIATALGKGTRADRTNFSHMTEMLASLSKKGCIRIGDTTRNGTLYTVILPKDIPSVKEKMVVLSPLDSEEDYFNDPNRRKELFERDKWTCQYCGEEVTKENVTLDHFVPQSKGGKPTKNNLKTSCLICNAIKSGKTYEEAAPLLLKSIQERKARLRGPA